MNLCSDNHDEISFEGRNCPACEIISDKDSKISDLEDTILNLKSEIEELKESNQQMNNEVEQARKDLILTRDGQRDGQT